MGGLLAVALAVQAEPRGMLRLRLPPSPPRTPEELFVGKVGRQETQHCRIMPVAVPGNSTAYALPPRPREIGILPQDIKTPDNHVERDARLIRLTGVHPFNVEAPLSELFDEGFLNSKNLHYVRNHGAVPRVEDKNVLDWEFSVEGMVQFPCRMTLRRLLEEYEQVTMPVTLVCAGNRRKELNVVRKTKGFSWGAAGLSTALWTGVSLQELLGRALPRRGARYVCFEGADELPNGSYGTSVKLTWALDANRGMMVAHKMNGEPLTPDHGKPLRIIIPGQIGGRSVKWLKRIVVTETPSENWYHIYDNRVLPTTISPETSANLPDTWKDERYAIYDLNTNSVTVKPAHDEVVSLDHDHKPSDNYKLQGYAYSGGGRRVTRLEVTLDKGKTWILANISYPEDSYRSAPDKEMLFGGRLDVSWRDTCFCWCFWDLEMPISQLQEADDILIRAMDESMMVQPRDMYWSVLGMMNNPWYRVVIHKDASSLKFEHPTQPALLPGGWMERLKKAGGNLSNGFWGEKIPGEEEVPATQGGGKEICMTNAKTNRSISMEELRQHDGEESPWFVVNGEVYDGAGFLEGHPGGAASIVGGAGQDVSEEFLAIHSENAKGMMPAYHIGSLDAASRALLNDCEVQSSDLATRPVFLQPKAWTRGILKSKKPVSSDSKILTFQLGHSTQSLGLPIGQHLLVRLRDPATREAIIRAYTPISEGEVGHGTLRLLVKMYRDGHMSQALEGLPIGHWVDFKGPVGKFTYLGGGRCQIGGAARQVDKFTMLCGGSGVTPIFQVLRAVMKDARDPTRCAVLCGNRTEEDILLRAEMDLMAAANREKCHVLHILSKPSEGWEGLTGRINETLLQRHVGQPAANAQDTLFLICGPPAMEENVKGCLTQMGWPEDKLLFF